ncbi:hypothetical protein Sgleb_09560 [Streptomyces glebosus]|uniref:Uncharacterized protein n=1 Tax=Streptomyces glebosus TaxID=249580 RepID=A0A640SNE5_9ACTN|nr:hypothetical protein Sgleb_09560 [Streptomyces glebosus]GHG57422.1 hypothetical protein GCM10010513_20850 [Streptomyces glebosus]
MLGTTMRCPCGVPRRPAAGRCLMAGSGDHLRIPRKALTDAHSGRKAANGYSEEAWNPVMPGPSKIHLGLAGAFERWFVSSAGSTEAPGAVPAAPPA